MGAASCEGKGLKGAHPCVMPPPPLAVPKWDIVAVAS